MIDEGHIEEQAAARALRALSPEEETRVDQHVAVCPLCKAMLQEAQEMVSMLALTVQPARPSRQCKERLMARIGREASPKTVRRAARMLEASPKAARSVRLPIWASRAVIASALIGLLVWNVMLQREIAHARMIQYMVVTDHQPTSLKPQGGVGASVHARVFLGPNGDDAVLVIENLPSPPPGKVYQVWIANEKQQRSMHTFQVSHTVEQVLMQTGEPLSRYKWIMITIENEGGSPSPSEHTVLLGDL